MSAVKKQCGRTMKAKTAQQREQTRWWESSRKVWGGKTPVKMFQLHDLQPSFSADRHLLQEEVGGSARNTTVRRLDVSCWAFLPRTQSLNSHHDEWKEEKSPRLHPKLCGSSFVHDSNLKVTFWNRSHNEAWMTVGLQAALGRFCKSCPFMSQT